MVVFVLENVISKISDFCKIIIEQLKRIQLNRLRKSVGAILIEFAFAIPVFLVLLYYIHDLPKLRLLQRKMQFVAYEMSSILQNIAKQRQAAGTVITKQDIANTMKLVYLSIYTGNTIDGTVSPSKFPLGHYPYIGLMMVQGTGNNTAIGKWRLRSWGGIKSCTMEGFGGGNGLSWSSKETSSTTFYPKLSISQGENKIILQCVLYYAHAGKYDETFSNGTPCKNVSVRDAFGFLLFKPEGIGGV